MIEHIFIKNYKAFSRENIPLDRNTLLIGTYHTGKTTVLESLDLFFNHKLNREYIIDKTKDIVIELHINDHRYRKVYSPPNYDINFTKCIGNVFDIQHIKYIYVPKKINNPSFINDVLTIELNHNENKIKQNPITQRVNELLPDHSFELYSIDTRYQLNINKKIDLTKKDCFDMISKLTYPYVIIGIDDYERNFFKNNLQQITSMFYQTILTSNDVSVVKNYNYYISQLYKGNKAEDFKVIKSRIRTNKTYLLVEGKYDVNWFETALKLLGKVKQFTVIPCGGSGNITFVKEQLEKEGFDTIVVTDGDMHKNTSLTRDVIEMYADIEFINNRFRTKFKEMPTNKKTFFKRFSVKDDVVKNVLSRWAKNNLTYNNDFVQELGYILESSFKNKKAI